jgi:nucleoprotein TPR
VSTLRTQLVEQKAAFKQEIASQQRLAQSAERRAEDARNRLEEVEREWEEDLARRKESDARTDEERLVWEEQRADLDAKVAELRDTVDRLVESGIAGDADSLPEDSSADQGAMLFSPSAALAGSLMRKRGMGISELYVENVRTKTELSKQQQETRRLEDTLEALLRDIQERAPLLRQQRQEWTRLVATANDLAGQLSTVTTERDAEARRVWDEAAKVKQLQAAKVDLESHISDLSRQVVSLVREIGVRDEPSLVQYQHLDDAEMEQPEGDDIDSVITRNLIVFRSIPELQAQNQQLIKVVRELGKQLEAAEKTGAAAPSKGAAADGETDAEALAMMDEAGEIILGLKAKVEEKEVALAKQTRERDLFAKMLSQAGLSLPVGLDLEAGGGTGGALLDVVKRNLESFRAELGLDAERLRQELAEARKEVNTASIALVRVEAERDFLKDRITALTEAGNLQTIQFDGLVTQNQGIKTDLMRVNMELRQAEEKRIEVEGHAERARMEAANLRAEKELWRATEEKLQKDVAEVAKDRAGLQSLIESLRRAEAETLRVQEETRRTALQTISNLQVERCAGPSSSGATAAS